MDNEHDIHWSPNLEKLVAELGERASGLAWLHNKARSHYEVRHNGLAIPVIILSTLAGAASTASASLFGDSASASLAIGGVSILTGILQTINSYFGFGQRSAGHKFSALQYQKLHDFIAVEMSLQPTERLSAKDALKVIRETTERLGETSPAIPDSIIKRFNDEFTEKYPDVAKPSETNGIKKILIVTQLPKTPTATPILHLPSPNGIRIGMEV